ncbi:MAG: YhcH/YjgK/YiaL family protein [Verrucomicrobia bacterium]|nr:YhcH/YjgK/YiaL family protein [Verrucomicrobiota bacterium]
MALYGSIETVREQAPKQGGIATAFAYLDELMQPGSAAHARVRAIAPGDTVKTELAGGVFVIEQTYETRLRADGFFESHRKFIDVQVVVEGEEAMEIADVSRMTVKQPYNEKRDLIIYEDNTEASLLRVHAGQVAVFFPNDVHMPTLRVRAAAVNVRKCVVKVPVGQ